MASKREKMEAAKKEQQRIHGVVVAATTYFVVNGEVVSYEDIDPEHGEARQYRRQFPESIHD